MTPPVTWGISCAAAFSQPMRTGLAQCLAILQVLQHLLLN